MKDKNNRLKYRYSFSDFLFYTASLAVPVVTAVTAILDQSVAAAVVFVLLAAAGVVVMLRFFCTRCPHYCREKNTLKCIFFWGLPKFFSPRPGPLGFKDKFLSFACPALVFLYPVYWLWRQPGLLIIYLLSAGVFAASVRRNECPRCIYDECPANIAGRCSDE